MPLRALRGSSLSKSAPKSHPAAPADGLSRLQHFQFPFELNDVTRAYYAASARIESGSRAADMRAILKTPPDLQAAARLSQDAIDNSTLHTTCVATRLNAGHANNALSQASSASVLLFCSRTVEILSSPSEARFLVKMLKGNQIYLSKPCPIYPMEIAMLEVGMSF